jgi:cell division protein FtsN
MSSMMATGGMGVIMMLISVGIAGWAWGKTQMDSTESGPGGMPHGMNNGHAGSGPIPKPNWQRSQPGATPGASASTPKSTWEQKREEMRKKQDEQKLKEQKEEAEKKRQEAADALKREQARTREREAREREARERNGGSPNKRHQQPTARTAMGSDEDAYSFRPYDKPKQPAAKPSHSSMYSESSYAPSHSTSRTTPPPSSHRGPYSTKDPDKIVVKAVYSFLNGYTKVPTAQLISGMGSVTDGLILRITTEGLFIDDDVRGVPQREWDVKAWTMKLVEVCFPSVLATRDRDIKDHNGYLRSYERTNVPGAGQESDPLFTALSRPALHVAKFVSYFCLHLS